MAIGVGLIRTAAILAGTKLIIDATLGEKSRRKVVKKIKRVGRR